MQEENKMGTMPVNRLLVTMSLPMMISMDRKVSGGRGGALPSGGDHIRHPGCAGIIVGQ